MKSPEIKNCPICGEMALYDDLFYHAISCTNPECDIELINDLLETTKEQAVQKWNNLHNLLEQRLRNEHRN